MTDAPAAANVQGDLYKPTRLAGRKKKIRKEARTLYVNRPVLNRDEIAAWAKSALGMSAVVEDLHVTLAHSKAPLEWPDREVGPLRITPINPSIQRFGPELDCVVLAFECPELEERWAELAEAGAEWKWPGYHAHITLSYSGFNRPDLHPPEVAPYSGPIVLGSEEFSEVVDNWKSGVVEKGERVNHSLEIHRMGTTIEKIGARNSRKDMATIQAMHDHAVTLGACCSAEGPRSRSEDDVDKRDVRIAKIDESLGLVFGYAIVCKIDGEDYYDLNVDKRSDGSYERVPEHIPEASMLKAAMSFMETARPGNELHTGDDVGTYVFAFPLTTDIAKAFGIQTRRTGLMVAYKPPAEVFAKFKSGEYKGFSIEGRRVSAKMLES